MESTGRRALGPAALPGPMPGPRALALFVLGLSLLVAVALAARTDSAHIGVATPATESSLSLSLSVGTSTAGEAPERSEVVGARLLLANGRIAWACRCAESKAVSRAACNECRNQKISNLLPGDYDLVLEARTVPEGAPLPLPAFRLTLNGRENALEARAFLWETPDPEPFRALELRVRRIYDTTHDIELLPAWRPTPDAPLVCYRIRNHSPYALIGDSWRSNFFGSLRRFEQGQWVPYFRGGLCGTVPEGQPILAGAQGGTCEGAFIGEPRPFAPGHYRYVVRYALGPEPRGMRDEDVRDGRSALTVIDVYEAHADFDIAAAAP